MALFVFQQAWHGLPEIGENGGAARCQDVGRRRRPRACGMREALPAPGWLAGYQDVFIEGAE